jgi:hypothetical protein
MTFRTIDCAGPTLPPIQTGAEPTFCHRSSVLLTYLRTVFNCSKNKLSISWCYMYSML